jgi:hypothetical protein
MARSNAPGPDASLPPPCPVSIAGGASLEILGLQVVCGILVVAGIDVGHSALVVVGLLGYAWLQCRSRALIREFADNPGYPTDWRKCR